MASDNDQKKDTNYWLDRALKTIKSPVIPDFSKDVQIAIDKSLSCLKEGDCEAALGHISPHLEKGPVKDLYYVAGMCHITGNNLQEAKAFLEKELEHFPGNEPVEKLLEDIKKDLNSTTSITISDSQKPTSTEKATLKFMQVHGFYETYTDLLYGQRAGLQDKSFDEQVEALVEDAFAAPQLYAPYMSEFGYESSLVIGNCMPSQARWAFEHKIGLADPRQWKTDITAKQIDFYKPDVLYLGDCIHDFDTRLLKAASHKPKLVIGWRAASIPEGTDWSGFDVILSGLGALREAAPRYGAKEAIDFYPGYPERINKNLEGTPQDYDLSFCGQWTYSQHPKRNEYLCMLARAAEGGEFSIAYYLSGGLDALPPVISKYQKEPRFGLGMHRALLSGKITFDARGIIGIGVGAQHDIKEDLAKKETTNMRLFEATGAGAFLLTEYHDNLKKYFEAGKEIETFTDEKELFEKIAYYLAHPEERQKIARAGQSRCLSEHSMQKRASALDKLIRERVGV